MVKKLEAICDSIDFIVLAIKEIEEYPSLKEIREELDDLKSELLDEYNETREKIPSGKDIYEF